MAKYRKKPVVIEAFKWTVDEAPVWWMFRNDLVITDVHKMTVAIPTLEGVMTADRGDWIIQGIKKEIYPCKPDIFEATYELVEEGNENEPKN